MVEDRASSWTKALCALLVVGLSLAVVACTDDPSAEPAPEPAPPEETGPRNGGDLVVALADAGRDWSPAAAPWTPSQLEVGRTLYDRVAVYSDLHQLLPELAESIEPNRDFTEWTITLRDEIVFHDGTPLDAGALKTNIEAQQLSPVAGPLLTPVRSVFVTGPRTVRVSMKSPWSTFPHVFTSQVGFVASPDTVTTPEGAARPVGTGPFEFVTSTDESIEVTKNSTYWRDGLPRLDAVSFRVIADGEARIQALQAGRVDMVMADDPATIRTLRTVAESATVDMLLDRNAEAPKLTFVFNTARPPFLDPVARNAVAIATDRAALTAAGYDGVLVPAKGPISDQSVFFIDQTFAARDVAQAREDVEQYVETYGIPLAFTLKVPSEEVYVRFAALWQQQLREAGILMSIEILDPAMVRLAAAMGDFQAVLLDLFPDWHPDTYYPVLHQAQMTPPGSPGLNYPRFGSLTIDEALDKARETGELGTQVDSYRQVQNSLAASNAYLFVVRLPEAVGARVDVRDLTNWVTAAGPPGLPQERGTVSLTFAWLDRPEVQGE